MYCSGSLLAQGSSTTTPFSQDSAWSYLTTIAGSIGPRPMGSPNERAAFNFALGKFREFGLHEAFLLPMKQTVSVEAGGNVNTNSGCAVGVLRGRSKRTIVIGGHMDSAGPDIPGANDDGSGSATVVELARVLAQKEHESTIVFALFGGEEQGLRGSRRFVLDFDRMDDVALMLQIDMTNGTEWLLPLVDAKDHMTPEWLVKASYEEFAVLGYSGLKFPTHFYSFLTSMPGGGIGSDHEPFLERNIPAIDFTSDVTDPIHTPQDNLQNFTPSGLKRSGDLVYRLVERFDAGVPAESSGSYYLMQVGSILLFFPLWSIYILYIVALGVSAVAVRRVRSQRIPEDPRPKVPGLKLFLLMLLIQTCVWLSENVVGIIKGHRFPWLDNFDGYFVLGFLAGCLGIWFALQLVPRLNFSRDPYRYALKSLVSLGVLLIITAPVAPKVGLAPAMGLLFLSCAFLVEAWYWKFILWLLAPHFMYRLIFSEGFGLLARTTSQIPIEGFFSSFILHAFYILFFSLWSFPFLLGFAAIRFQKPGGYAALSFFRTRTGGAIAVLLVAASVIYLAMQPTYSQFWKQPVTIQHTMNLDTKRATIDVSSNDFLKGATIHADGRDTLIEGRERRIRLAEFPINTEPWIRVDRRVEVSGGDKKTFNLLFTFHFKYRPYTFSVSYHGGTKVPEDVETPLAWSPAGKSIMLRWYSFPDTLLIVPLKMTVMNADTLTEYVNASFVEPLRPATLDLPLSSIQTRTIVNATAHIAAQKDQP